MKDDALPDPGPPFEPGDEIAFFPAEIATPDDPGWLRWDYAVVDDVNADAETFGFHFVSRPFEHASQGMENIVRRTPTYYRWRASAERVTTSGQDLHDDAETVDLWIRVLSEHPIHGGSEFPHPAVKARRGDSNAG